MTFKVFDAEAAGNALPSGTAWEETQNVEVVDGIFNVLLGDVTPLPVELFDGEPTDAAGPLRFLEAMVGGETLVPRRRLTSVAYALRAGTNNLDLANSMAGSGLITKDGMRFIHNFGTDNTFVGVAAGNLAMTGNGNTGTGASALRNNTTGSANTATGESALRFNTTGANNTATGEDALRSNTTGSANTATGAEALQANTTAHFNTATGAAALEANTTGSDNTATGSFALRNNITGFGNTATGRNALLLTTTGFENTATGTNALLSNTDGVSNTATGARALFSNTTGTNNTATGVDALRANTTGANNIATGLEALVFNITGSTNVATGARALRANIIGSNNTAIGTSALFSNTTGNENTAVGFGAGVDHEAGDNNIYVKNPGLATESNTIRIGTLTHTDTFIAGISKATSASGVAVFVNNAGKLGTETSSRRFKQDVRDMGEASTGLMRLRPVTFQYRSEYDDGTGLQQYGLVAEEVAEVFPDLVQYSDTGEPSAVRYHFVNAMLLNEVQKQHRRIVHQQEEIEQQKKEIGDLSVRLARLETLMGPQARR